ncbi:C39 family peptidase [Microcoleus sp. B7-D4]|uniref:C39 family peptidase n=1 Tax=Microcoleus sp. B7-D4 TaxID=2818696 RepID=UPI002FD51FA4
MKYQLTITQPTIIKKRPLQSIVLPSNEKRLIAADSSFYLNSCKDDREHWQIRFADSWSEIWYIFKKHCVVNEVGYPLIQERPASIKLKVPYKSQLDNEENPTGSCNVTSLAMAIEFLDPDAGDLIGRQFEDHLYRLMENNGLSRHNPQDLAKIVTDFYHLQDDFTVFGSFERCRNHLAMGNPCVIHGYFTSFGHIVTLAGYDATGFLVHDPYGEWFPDGYDTAASGAFLHYSYDLITQVCMPDDQFWVHYIEKR